MNQNIIPFSCSSLAQYFNHINCIPILTPEQEAELTSNLTKENRQKLAYHHLRLVAGIASKYTTSSQADTGDLIQAGNLGLLKGMNAFEGGRGVRVSTYVSYHIRNEICEWILCNWSPVKIATTKEQRKVFFNVSKLKGKMTQKEIEQLATELNVEVKELIEMRTRIQGRNSSVTFDSIFDESDNENHTTSKEVFEAVAVDGNNDSLVTFAEEEQQEKQIWDVVNNLKERQRDIIVSRFLSPNPSSLRELAEKYGVSQQRIGQIELDAIKILRTKLSQFVCEC